MKAIHRKRLLKLATFLREKVPDEHWNFGFITNRTGHECEVFRLIAEKKQHGCGAAACAMGWAPVALPKLFTWGTLGAVHLLKGGRSGDFAICDGFGLSEDERHYLFECDSYPSYANTTRLQVARRIEQFVARGGMPKSRSRA